jgi:hypothetical protein
MKKRILLSLFFIFSYTKIISQQTDYNTDLYLTLYGIGNGSLCGYYAPNYQPGDKFQYGASGYIDLYKLYNIPYRKNTFYNNANQTYWTTFGGFGHPTLANTGFIGKIDDNKKDNVGKGFNVGNSAVGILKFTNVRVQGTISKWMTQIWVNVFSQCHHSCSQGTWWKYTSPLLTADESRKFISSHNVSTYADQYVNGSLVDLTVAGNPSCTPTAVYGFGPGELN